MAARNIIPEKHVGRRISSVARRHNPADRLLRLHGRTARSCLLKLVAGFLLPLDRHQAVWDDETKAGRNGTPRLLARHLEPRLRKRSEPRQCHRHHRRRHATLPVGMGLISAADHHRAAAVLSRLLDRSPGWAGGRPGASDRLDRGRSNPGRGSAVRRSQTRHAVEFVHLVRLPPARRSRSACRVGRLLVGWRCSSCLGLLRRIGERRSQSS